MTPDKRKILLEDENDLIEKIKVSYPVSAFKTNGLRMPSNQGCGTRHHHSLKLMQQARFVYHQHRHLMTEHQAR